MQAGRFINYRSLAFFEYPLLQALFDNFLAFLARLALEIIMVEMGA